MSIIKKCSKCGKSLLSINGEVEWDTFGNYELICSECLTELGVKMYCNSSTIIKKRRNIKMSRKVNRKIMLNIYLLIFAIMIIATLSILIPMFILYGFPINAKLINPISFIPIFFIYMIFVFLIGGMTGTEVNKYINKYSGIRERVDQGYIRSIFYHIFRGYPKVE